jgi:3-hydroxymyristoyl/3-hydroxydecanoyl-(acyl carrier protein) dehydratase
MPILQDSWLPLKDIRTTQEGFWESDVRFSPSSEWFSGHFDEFPLVPGVALLALVTEVVKRKGSEQGRLLKVSGFSRVRFKRLTSPDEDLHISVAVMPPGSEAELVFQVSCYGHTVAQGVMKAGEEVSGG